MAVNLNGYLGWIASIEQMFDGANLSLSTLSGTTLAVVVILAVVSILWCFFGLKMVRIWSAILGFALGGFIGLKIAAQFQLDTRVILIIGIAAGIVLACLGAILYRVGIFLVVGLAAESLAFSLIQPANTLMTLVCFGIGLVVALLTVVYAEPVTMVVTALYGAIGLGRIVALILPIDTGKGGWISYLLIFVFLMLGAWVQFLLESGKRKKQSIRKAKEIREQNSAEKEVEKARALMENLDNLPEEEEKVDADQMEK